ncbi:transcriptional regulator, IclR family [Desulfofundulus kuznetsovii DSM 6115]|uniref:Transcriptional regulator, IclR family n=1 Tax=Desulfofundulus kuznetsovii (strain DSM 6115 / VKM B-1805 / 17) TaxID=760568 RepID=A0AAU8P9C2_DESK7|nr:transcriptional regulator, IclR family [Desulfofundulus kuznetsovii DSM 6115]
MENGIRSLTKALKILDSFTLEKPELSIGEIVFLLDMPKTTVIRLVSTLEKNKYLERDQVTKKYRLGTKLLCFANIVQRTLKVREVALPVMKEIRDQSGETVYLNIIENDERMCVEYVESNQELQRVVFVGQRSPLYAGASAKVLLAYLPEVKIKEYLSKIKLEALASHTITNSNELLEELTIIRNQGYAISNSELIEGVFSICAPVFNHERTVVASLALGLPAVRANEKRITEFIALVKSGAKEISRRLGYDGP